jgi:hypothetical protein
MSLKFSMRGFDGMPGNRRTDRLPAQRERHPDDGERLKACWDRLYQVALLAAEFRGGEQHDRQTR